MTLNDLLPSDVSLMTDQEVESLVGMTPQISVNGLDLGECRIIKAMKTENGKGIHLTWDIDSLDKFDQLIGIATNDNPI